MPNLTYRATLQHRVEDVFAFVSDAENNPRWHEHVRETRWIDPGPTRLGRRARQFGHLFGRDWAFVAEVAEWDPPHRVAFQVIQGVRIRTTIALEPVEGGTILTLSVRTPRLLAAGVDRLVGRVMQRITANRERGDIRRLRRALAARANPADGVSQALEGQAER
jgi:uncharacterized protein YndB with AHSA1/START domain